MLLTVEVSFNQPKFRLNATWNSNATTFANESVLFINSNNSIYISNKKTNEISIWYNGNNSEPSRKISNSLSNLSSIFVTINGDIYLGNGANRVYLFVYWIEIKDFVQTNYSSHLSNNSHRCHRLKDCRLGNYYCEMIEIHMRDEGNYTFRSHSTQNWVGYIYENNFTLFHLNINAIELLNLKWLCTVRRIVHLY